MTPINLDEIQQDATVELMNISVGRACKSLSRLTGHEVGLSVPEVSFNFFDPALFEGVERCTAISQPFSGQLKGKTLIIFPQTVADTLVKLFLGGKIPEGVQLEDVEADALTEIGNIILNACIGTLTNQLKCQLETQFPAFYKGTSEAVLEWSGMVGRYSMVLRTRFTIAETNIDSYLTVVMDADSLDAFQTLLNTYLAIHRIR